MTAQNLEEAEVTKGGKRNRVGKQWANSEANADQVKEEANDHETHECSYGSAVWFRHTCTCSGSMCRGL